MDGKRHGQNRQAPVCQQKDSLLNEDITNDKSHHETKSVLHGPQLSRKTGAHLEVVPDGSAVQLDQAMLVAHAVWREPSGVVAWARQTPSRSAPWPRRLLVGGGELLLLVASQTLRIQLCHAYQNACVPFHVLPETAGGVPGLATIHGRYAGGLGRTRTQWRQCASLAPSASVYRLAALLEQP